LARESVRSKAGLRRRSHENDRIGMDVDTERTLIKAVHAAIRNDEEDFEAQLEAFATKDALLAADARCADLAALIIMLQLSSAGFDGGFDYTLIGSRAGVVL
jgi:hypothetical protein